MTTYLNTKLQNSQIIKHSSKLFFKQEQDPKFYDRLYEALHLLVDFFSINGQGLSGAKLLTESYNKMELLYGLNKVRIGPKKCIFIICQDDVI